MRGDARAARAIERARVRMTRRHRYAERGEGVLTRMLTCRPAI